MRQDGIIWERGVGPLGYDGSSGTLSGFGIAEVDDAHGGQGGGFPPLCYGEDGGQEGHSLRTGGATAARKLEVLGAYIKAQGDWKSDCFERYCELDSDQRLILPGAMAEATAALG
eukprot:gene14304-biopygen14746